MRPLQQFGLLADLTHYNRNHNKLRIGLIGCGEMGTDLITQFARLPQFNLCAVADHKPQRIIDAAQLAYKRVGHAVEVSSKAALSNCIAAGKLAAVYDSELLLHHEEIDLIIDATGIPNSGAQIGIQALENNKHLVSMNVETDVTIGAYLQYLARKHQRIYSLGAGDEPSACMELIRFAHSLQLPVVCAGKGKNNPLNPEATPDLYAEEAAARQMNPRMLVEFIDGSKTMVEMACLANATGLVPDCPGMHGPRASLDQLPELFCLRQDGGLLSQTGVVDYSIGAGVSPGVFVITKVEDPRLLERFRDLKMGKGPYFTLFRPYHLTSLEVPLTCARIALYNQADLTPLSVPTAEVCAVAKKDLPANTRLDSIGEYCYRAWTLTASEARAKKAHPCGLLKGGVTTAFIKQGELLTTSNVTIDETAPIALARQLQDNYLKEHHGIVDGYSCGVRL